MPKSIIFYLNDKRGSLMIEAITSLSVSLMGLLGVISLLSNSIAFNRDAGQKIIGTYLAAEGIELVKNKIDTNYSEGNSWNLGLSDGTYEVGYGGIFIQSGNLGAPNSSQVLNLDETTGIYSYNPGTPTLFRRTIRLQNISSGGSVNEIKLVSIVEWLTRRSDQSVNLEDHFFDWR